jgi:hypothetical protein
MKKITLFLGMLCITSIAISQTTQVCPISFKRSNGAGSGCNIARLTLTYADCPTTALQIDSVFQSGVKINETFGPGVIDCSGPKAEVNYCVTSGNIAPTGFLTIYFHAGGAFDGNTCTVPDGGGGGAVLPVKLTDFYAKRNLSVILLSWKTETELNAKSFVLQRKTGSEWIDITTIYAKNSLNGGSYSYTDLNSNKGISQYRLKVVDLDGSFSNSDIRAVKGTSSVSDFTVYPNPSTGNTKVTVADISEPTDIQLIDNSGRMLKNIPMNNSNTVNINDLQKGIYMIRIVNKTSGETLTKKVTVIN